MARLLYWITVLMMTGATLASPASAQTGASSQCPCTGAGTTKSQPPAAPKPPAPARDCSKDARSCDQRATDDAKLLEADALRTAGRWKQAADKYLEILKRVTDPKTAADAKSRYRETSALWLVREKADDARLLDAGTEERAGRWDTAATKYLAALRQASDASVLGEARAGYARATAVTSSRAWRWSKYFAPFWWFHLHPVALFWTLIALVVIVVSPRLGKDGVFAWTGKLLQLALRPTFNGRARITATTTLTDDAPGQLFTAQLPHSAEEVRRRWMRVSGSFLSGSTTLLSMPNTLADQIVGQIPEIKGVISLSKFAAFFRLLSQYFSWRVESQVGFVPDAPKPKPKPGQLKAPTTGRIRAYATLRWAWYVKGSYMVHPRATGAMDFERASYAIAARIIGAAQKKTL